MKDHTKTTLGELLSHSDNTIIRNATSILKRLQKHKHSFVHYVDEQTGKEMQFCEECNHEEEWN